jgi:hypothetical protein
MQKKTGLATATQPSVDPAIWVTETTTPSVPAGPIAQMTVEVPLEMHRERKGKGGRLENQKSHHGLRAAVSSWQQQTHCSTLTLNRLYGCIFLWFYTHAFLVQYDSRAESYRPAHMPKMSPSTTPTTRKAKDFILDHGRSPAARARAVSSAVIFACSALLRACSLLRCSNG